MADLDLYNQVAQSGRDPILAHVGLVKRTALHLKARIPQVMDVDVLIQVGMIGQLKHPRVLIRLVVSILRFLQGHGFAGHP